MSKLSKIQNNNTAKIQNEKRHSSINNGPHVSSIAALTDIFIGKEKSG